MGIGMSCCCTKERQVCHACSTRSLNKKIAQRWPICFDRLTKKHRAGKKEKRHHRKYDYPIYEYN